MKSQRYYPAMSLALVFRPEMDGLSIKERGPDTTESLLKMSMAAATSQLGGISMNERLPNTIAKVQNCLKAAATRQLDGLSIDGPTRQKSQNAQNQGMAAALKLIEGVTMNEPVLSKSMTVSQVRILAYVSSRTVQRNPQEVASTRESRAGSL